MSFYVKSKIWEKNIVLLFFTKKIVKNNRDFLTGIYSDHLSLKSRPGIIPKIPREGFRASQPCQRRGGHREQVGKCSCRVSKASTMTRRNQTQSLQKFTTAG